MTATAHPLRIAIVGSGPAGFYAAAPLLAAETPEFAVDMFERLPTPFGLVRSGVAPDHPKIKSVSRIYERTAAHPRYRFFGNVSFGLDVSRQDLLSHYHAIIYATGSARDRPLGIPGEELSGSLAATDFVGWYNAHPDHHDLAPALSSERAVVIGNGNVALDVARMLVLPQQRLGSTDTAGHALAAFANSSVREVVVIGRRGPAQAAFTNPEMRELREIEGVDIHVDRAELDAALAGVDLGQLDAARRNNIAMLREYAEQTAARQAGSRAAGASTERRRRIVFRFLLSPIGLRGENGRLGAVEFVQNRLVNDGHGSARAEPTGQHERIDGGLLIRAVGYRGAALPDVPFDDLSGTIPNAGGRVHESDAGPVRRGEYAVGWIKRGPSGIIGTNKKDALESVEALLEDLAAGGLPEPPISDPDAIEQLLAERKPDHITYAGWQAIDSHERLNGERDGRPRAKLARVEELLAAANAGQLTGR